MRNYYVYEPALRVGSIAELESGISSLNSIFVGRDEDRDRFFCNPSIWECDTTQGKIYEMYGAIVSPELQRLIPHLFNSFEKHERQYMDDIELDSDFPLDCNGFAGFEFDATNIQFERRVFSSESYNQFVVRCLKYCIIEDKEAMRENLSLLYPKMVFSEKAVQDTLNWRLSNRGLYDRLLELFEDMPLNPIRGGIGETEVLRHMSGIASKRINQAHRVTYKLEKGTITVLGCNGHYD